MSQCGAKFVPSCSPTFQMDVVVGPFASAAGICDVLVSDLCSKDQERFALRQWAEGQKPSQNHMSIYFCILQQKVLLNHCAQDSSLCVTRLGGSQVDKRVHLDLCPRHFQMLRLTIDAKRWSDFTGCVNVILSEAVCVRLPLMHPARPI